MKIEERINTLLEGTKFPEKKFILSGASFRDVYNLAGSIQTSLSEYPTEGNICLCSDDKPFIAAAFLAALSGDHSLLIPYSFSVPILEEMQQTVPFKYVLSNKELDLPKGIERIKIDKRNTPLREKAILDKPFLKLFTGGSTGAPKVWTKTPENIFSETFFLQEKFSVSHNDLFAVTVPPQHIYGILFSVLLPLVSGASVINKICSFPQEIIRAIEEFKATILIGIPIHYRILNGKKINNKSLRCAFSSTGPLNPDDNRTFFQTTGVGIHEVYGSTETGGIASRCLTRGSTAMIPFECVQWKIDDELLQVKSDFISPELPRNNEGFFTTSDRCRYDDTNGFLLLGRADSIVKIAGKRVDLDEIREKIKKVTQIKDAVVLSLPINQGRDQEIIALIEGTISEQELRKILSEQIEPFAMPRRFKIVEKIPVSKTGKYNRKEIERFFVSSPLE